jgi:uncharacterized DUF497 family protein
MAWTSPFDRRFLRRRTHLSAKFGRYNAIGKDVNGVISVVFATLGLEGISVISMRRVSKTERRLYNEHLKG